MRKTILQLTVSIAHIKNPEQNNYNEPVYLKLKTRHQIKDKWA